jgi:putative DNA primase/helicase
MSVATALIDVESIPRELRDRDQWAPYRLEKNRKGKLTKVPYDAKTGRNASSTNPATWCPFDFALMASHRGGYDGIGYMFSADDPYFGVDIDHVRDDPERLTWALDIVARFDTYAEWSRSGTGIHIIGRGRLPEGGRNNRQQGIEVYDRARFFTFTGQLIEGVSG